MDRFRVVCLLVSLCAITYLDRVCISVAGPRIQGDLQIDPIGWGWVAGVFTIAYALFEIPSGLMGDRRGPRRILTRIVVWWSAFTALTGMSSSFSMLLLVRFLFGAGEAGALPNASIVVDRWFSWRQRATLSGVLLAAGQLGGALAPLLVVPIQRRYGWHMPFYVFGALGLVWAAIWYAWFRDSPAEKRPQDRTSTPRATYTDNTNRFPWRETLTAPSSLALLLTAFCYIYVYNFYQTWFHTFLVKGRGFTEDTLWLSAMPFVVAIFANLLGGAVSDAAVRNLGLRNGRRLVGAGALAVAGAGIVSAMLLKQPMATLISLTVAYAGITFGQSGVFGVCLDIGGAHAGAMVGMMNTAAQVGGFLGSIAFGYLVSGFNSYDAPFVPMALLLFVGAGLWLKIDASKPVRPSIGSQVPAPQAL